MRVLVTGAGGMLGSDVVAAFHSHEVRAATSADLDIRDLNSVVDGVAGVEVVVNCAAYTAVDQAESDEEAAFAVNALGVKHLAQACASAGAKLITISTDYVFDGTATSPYPEDTPRNPISAYGRTKAAGEEFALADHPDGSYIVRTAWLYGKNGPNFAKTMLNLAESKDTWSVVDDQVGQPTWTRDLAKQLLLLAESDALAGVYHGTNSGQASWYDFARAVLEESGLGPDGITPTDSSNFVRPAQRPAYSVLGHAAWQSAGLPEMRNWRDALRSSFREGALP